MDIAATQAGAQMKSTAPPALAAWLLEHLAMGPRNESLAGDLLEEFSSGRTDGWYWRQTLSAIAIVSSQALLNRGPIVAFAFLWSTLVPAWIQGLDNLERHLQFHQRLQQLNWPWPVAFDWGMLLAANLIFIWSGIALYHLSRFATARRARLRLLLQSVIATMPPLVALWAALIVLPKMFLEVHAAPNHTPSAYPITNLHIAAILVRLPFFVTVLSALWAVSRSQSRDTRIAG
jgi:hypothetical protein